MVASRVSEIQDVVAEGETGPLVPSGDPEALAAVIRCLTDPALISSMGRHAQAQVDLYSVDAMMVKIDRFYTRWPVAKNLRKRECQNWRQPQRFGAWQPAPGRAHN